MCQSMSKNVKRVKSLAGNFSVTKLQVNVLAGGELMKVSNQPYFVLIAFATTHKGLRYHNTILFMVMATLSSEKVMVAMTMCHNR